MNKAAHDALKQVRRSKTWCDSGTSLDTRHPAMVKDVELLLNLMSDSLLSKPTDASLFLIAVSTGARAIPCEVFGSQ